MNNLIIEIEIDSDGDLAITQTDKAEFMNSIIYLELDEVNQFCQKLKNAKNDELRRLGKI